ncbi:hypothetical protein HDA32_004308 [Spinactinospora alkalitolerans]|uniref:Uncharacterized protein n=1 Tax=Spinactinospora alkalitolerans TaxID=687207 RepID=A0A852TZ44_9ACTN|nr:hypothetical protein [Spinactinospora alkalitolerans]NYE49188.1 hypothetical protein [Spinactinospora alkalitolerans]
MTAPHFAAADGDSARPSPRVAALRRTTAAAALLVLVGAGTAGCVSSGGDAADPVREGGAAPSESAGPGRGGADLAGAGGESTLEVGGVKTEAVENDTIELATAGPMGEEDSSSAVREWTPRLTMAFSSARRDGDALVFAGEATYLHDEGDYTLHSKDFTVLDHNGEPAAEVAGFDEQYDEYKAAESEVLAVLTPDDPTREFSVAIAGVPPESEATEYADGTFSRYFQYETPERLWGYTVEAPRDYVPGRLCYAEGPEWHDVPLFEFTDIPCG